MKRIVGWEEVTLQLHALENELEAAVKAAEVASRTDSESMLCLRGSGWSIVAGVGSEGVHELT